MLLLFSLSKDFLCGGGETPLAKSLNAFSDFHPSWERRKSPMQKKGGKGSSPTVHSQFRLLHPLLTSQTTLAAVLALRPPRPCPVQAPGCMHASPPPFVCVPLISKGGHLCNLIVSKDPRCLLQRVRVLRASLSSWQWPSRPLPG